MRCRSFPRDLQCEKPVARCDRCGGEIYREDTLYAWEGTSICGLCIEDRFNALTTWEKAELLGARPVCPADPSRGPGRR